jgi:hypothetical protein
LKTQEHSIHQPHAKLFETVFSDPVEAVSFFQAYLPDALTTRIDWNTLVLKENSFIDEEFGILHLGLKVVYTFRKPEFGQSYSVGNN